MENTSRIEELKKFFEIDMSIKEMLIKNAPTEIDDLSTENRIEYLDRIYSELISVETSIFLALEKLGMRYGIPKPLRITFNRIKQQFLISDYDSLDLKRFYRDNFSDMNPQLVEKVKETCVGYSWDMHSPQIGTLIGECKSINEILHSIHSYVVNNDGLLKSMPKLASKQNEYDYPITLYGEETELARKLYEQFPLDLDCAWTEIVGMKNKILMMVRDRGHALTIDIDTTNEQEIMVRYFVPKLCNVGMIRALPGINKISENGASGIFRTDSQMLTQEIPYFIGKVPTDNDLNYYRKEELRNALIDVETNNLVRENLEQAPCFEEEEIKEVTETRAVTRISSIKSLLSKSIDKLLGRSNEKEER